MYSAASTSSSYLTSVQKSKRSHLDEFLPLYKKHGETNELKTRPKTTDKHRSESPKHQQLGKHRDKQAINLSQVIIDGSNLDISGGNNTPRNDSKVTSTPLANKKCTKSVKKLRKSTSTTEQSLTNNDLGDHSKSKSTKRSKSVSFLLEEKEQAIVKKSKSEDLSEGATGDTLQKKKKLKKNKKSKKDKADVSKTIETHSTHNESDEEDTIKKNKIKNKDKKKNKENSETEANQGTTKPKKAKKKKHQDKDDYEGEPSSKSPRTQLIADNLENLNLGESTHTLTNLIDEMVVVDKEKKKLLRKTANREKKQDEISNQKENGDPNNEVPTEKKKWEAKRWNKRQIAERDQNITIHIDNLPASLLKGNFKKVLIDHFSKYGLSRNVGEPIIQNEDDPNPVFTTKMFFNNAEAAAEALEMDGSKLAGNKIRVSPMRPKTETVLVIRIYDNPDKLGEKYIRTAFQDVGLIRSIKPMLRKKKTMATVFVEFDSPETVQTALKKCENLVINGKKIMANIFAVRTPVEKKKRQRGKGSKVRKVADEHSEGSGDE